jgi:hypothetical protein
MRDKVGIPVIMDSNKAQASDSAYWRLNPMSLRSKVGKTMANPRNLSGCMGAE